MDIKQVYEFVNTATAEALGQQALVQEDLGNIVDVGTQLFNANAVDKYVKSLVLHIGKVIFVNRAYKGSAPSVVRTAWEFGAVVEKIQADMPAATENETWELDDQQSYDQDIFYQPKVSAKFFSKKTTYEIPMSFTERQVKMSFSNAEQLNGFISMLYNEIEKSMTVKTDELIMRTINNAAAETVYDDYGADAISSKSGVKAVNLLYLYNTANSTSLTAADALITPEFIRFASYMIKNYVYRMGRISTTFNVGGKARFTPKEDMHVVLHSDFKSAAETYLYNGKDQFKDEYIKLPEADVVPYWQGSGTSWAFTDTAKIYCTTADNHSVTVTGVLGVIFDRDALGVANFDRRVTTHYNAKAEFYTNWYKADAGYYNDFNENFVVFFVA